MNPEKLIELLQLEPLPVEGGYFRRTYLSDETVAPPALPARYTRAKALGSAIYYLLHEGQFSAIHRLLSDEVYHFYLGDAVELLLLHPDGESQVVILGPEVEAGQQPQFVVPRGVWQGSRVKPGGRFALLGTTMAPAWEEADFELGERGRLMQEFPEKAELIRELTRDS